MADQPPVTSPGLHLQPLVHVRDMPASVEFYRRLGGEIIHGTEDADWVLMQVGTVQIGLVRRPADPIRGESAVDLVFGATAPLEQLRQRLPGAEIAEHRDFGEQLEVRSPDGLLIRINQWEPDPLT
ncbi:VOC family protein [Jidongwangia harbinensis]|uniref:VOC family protein n=1 Tax=Jidongwangia harbinensis TaxID=2878561 RepID=UPI001CD98C74|nr:VOC family protein [Jidongwangia harbinensis]MCA2213496.1 VOC family protein [Jidongwangia harbinensis]